VTAARWHDEYEARAPVFARLKEEVLFALDAELRRAGIKVHTLTGRVKTVDSLREKAERKGYASPLDDAGDIVGVRVVVLFMRDLPTVGAIVRNLFAVHASEDRVDATDPSTFGYMSQHYEATMRPTHTGPRYDDLRDVRFEVQVRTLLMDAWANVSHYLAYKGESSIPSELRRDFFALSGLFYVADKHFELFIAATRRVEEQTASQLRAPAPAAVELNLDTLTAFLHARYPERPHSDRAGVGYLVDELLEAGYANLDALERDLDAAREHLAVEPHQEQFQDVGAVRISLYRSNPEMERAAAARNLYSPDSEDEPYDPSEDDPFIDAGDE